MEDKTKRGLPLIKTFRGLRKGYTTGTCAAAACKAAAIAFFTGKRVKEVQITLPIGQTVSLPVDRCEIQKDRTIASIIKDAGDDPDVTSGAEIIAEVFTSASSKFNPEASGQSSNLKSAFQFTVHGPAPAGSKQGSVVSGVKAFQFSIFAGEGVGIVTKPGLVVPVGEPAINPVPRRMIEEAIKEIFNFQFSFFNLKSAIGNRQSAIAITISVPKGEEIAKKTMNARLGIIEGISILGTTGFVEPLSLSAYRYSIICAIDVAIASGCKEVVFSTGRSSEKVAERELGLPEEAFILVGDHMGFGLKKVKGQRSKVKKITIVGQFGKFSKMAAGHFETHCRDSGVELDFLAYLAESEGADDTTIQRIKRANTAREVFSILQGEGLERVFKVVCERVKENARRIADSGLEIGSVLVGYDNELVEKVSTF